MGIQGGLRDERNCVEILSQSFFIRYRIIIEPSSTLRGKIFVFLLNKLSSLHQFQRYY